jgi:hypothetical protein
MAKNTSKLPQITLYLPQEVIDALKEEANKNQRSMNKEATWIFMQVLGLIEKGGKDAASRANHY